MKYLIKYILISYLFCLIPQAQAARVYLNTADALKLLFKNSTEVVKEEKVLDSKALSELKQLLGYEPAKHKYTFYLGKTNNKIDAYALIDEQVGKVEPITFITKISVDGNIEQVEIMIYRETHGGDVAESRFLNQFKKKSLNDELRIGRGITNMTGSTLSSRALVIGTRRALSLWKYFYGK